MYTHNLDPIAFSVFGLPVRYYGLFFALLFILSYRLGQYYLKIYKKSEKKLDLIFFVCFFSVLLGARFGHVIFYELDYYLKNPLDIFMIWQGGLASHGAAIGLILGLFYIRKKTGYPLLFVSDIIALSSSLAVILVRLGNFFNGEIVGRVTNVPWAIVFPCNEYRITACGPELRHPSQLYEALLGLVVFLFLIFLFKKYKIRLPYGFLTGIFLIFYFGGRFFLEFFKEYTGTLFLYPLTNGQILSIPFIVMGIIVIYGKLDCVKKSLKIE